MSSLKSTASATPNVPSSRTRVNDAPCTDWIFTIVLLGVVTYLTNSVGFKREFSLLDTSIQHTFAVKERVPFWAAIVVAGAVPLVMIVVIGAVWRRSFWDVHNGLLGESGSGNSRRDDTNEDTMGQDSCWRWLLRLYSLISSK